MNSQQLKDLAEKAGFIDRGTNHTAYMNFDHEKFAELIVGECASVCENSNYEFGTIFTKMIKEHFGVEE